MSKRSATTDHFRQMESEAITAYREWSIFLVRREKHLLAQLAAAKPRAMPPKTAPTAPSEPTTPNFIEGITDGTLESDKSQTDERSNP